MSRSLTPDDLKVLLQQPESLTLLDVRRRGDFDADTVMLPGARWCDPEHISAWSQALLKEKEIVLYCVHGRAVSNTVVDDLQRQGFRTRLIEGGIAAWKESGGETVPKSQGYQG
jgi:rhodanese-related sulfurtransferase